MPEVLVVASLSGCCGRIRLMRVVVPPFQERLGQAVAHYWAVLDTQARRQKAGDADRGQRSAVTGGKQMDGFCDLLKWFLLTIGLDETNIRLGSKLELPGYFRPTKGWDMLIIHDYHLIAALEFKSQKGPSFGNNFNNRAEEALGNATDLWTAHRQGAFGLARPRPWLGWVMLLEESEASTRSVGVAEPNYKVFEEFRDTSYAERYELLLRKLNLEKFYDGTAFITSTKEDGPRGKYREPAPDLTMKTLLAGLAGHVAGYMAAIS